MTKLLDETHPGEVLLEDFLKPTLGEIINTGGMPFITRPACRKL